MSLQSHEMVAKWEESKKWQQLSDKQKERIRSKEREIERLLKQTESLQRNLDRCDQHNNNTTAAAAVDVTSSCVTANRSNLACSSNKDKDLLEKRLQSAKSSAGRPVGETRSAGDRIGSAPAGGREKLHDVEQLKRENHELNSEVSDVTRRCLFTSSQSCVRVWQVTQLKRELLRSRDAAYNELQMRNKFLSERLEELETHLRQRGKSDTTVASMVRLRH